jgi:hypothetical protein
MSPNRVIIDSELHTLLRRSRVQRIVLTWLVVLLWALLLVLVVWVQGSVVESCERGTQAAAERAEIAHRLGAYEIERSARARTRLECPKRYFVV